jgi:hypothetical protein
MSNATKGAAKKSAMGELHDKLAQHLTDVIENGEEVSRGGETFKVPASAAMLGVAARFLRDNNIECDPGYESAPIGELTDAVAAQLKEMEEDGDIPEFSN